MAGAWAAKQWPAACLPRVDRAGQPPVRARFRHDLGVSPSVPDGEAITADGLEALRADLEELETAGRQAMAERINAARQLGDLKENAEYHIAKDDQAHLETRIKRLRERLRNAVVVEADAGSADASASAGPPRSSTRRAGGSTRGRSSARRRPTSRRASSRRSRRSPRRFSAALPARRWRSRLLAGPAGTASSGSSRRPRSGPLEDQPVVVEQLALEADAVGADARR